LPNVKLQAVCASSANGLDAALEWSRLTSLPFYAVGPQSAEAARKRGFNHVSIAASGNLSGLAAMITAHMLPGPGPLLYLSGSEVSGDLAALLHPHGIVVERLVVYDAVSIELANLTTTVASADGVLLYSPRAARLWAQATEGFDVGSFRHFCLSPNVAAQLPHTLPISVAQTPDESGMMALLD
jgi:uroporphyrinogen-III synthase